MKKYPNDQISVPLTSLCQAGLGHELGLGSPCQQCGVKCPGLELHYWKKVCQHCRCGKLEHGVVERTDHGSYWVGKIFDRPLRTREEEYSFIYGDLDIETERPVRLDWVPPGPSKVVNKYLQTRGEDNIPIQAGTLSPPTPTSWSLSRAALRP